MISKDLPSTGSPVRDIFRDSMTRLLLETRPTMIQQLIATMCDYVGRFQDQWKVFQVKHPVRRPTNVEILDRMVVGSDGERSSELNRLAIESIAQGIQPQRMGISPVPREIVRQEVVTEKVNVRGIQHLGVQTIMLVDPSMLGLNETTQNAVISGYEALHRFNVDDIAGQYPPFVVQQISKEICIIMLGKNGVLSRRYPVTDESTKVDFVSNLTAMARRAQDGAVDPDGAGLAELIVPRVFKNNTDEFMGQRFDFVIPTLIASTAGHVDRDDFLDELIEKSANSFIVFPPGYGKPEIVKIK